MATNKPIQQGFREFVSWELEKTQLQREQEEDLKTPALSWWGGFSFINEDDHINALAQTFNGDCHA